MSDFIGTIPDAWRKLYTSNQSGTTVTKPDPTTTEPTGNGIFVVNRGSIPFNAVGIAFFGTNAGNETFIARITGWRKTTSGANTTLWVPSPLLLLAGILGSTPGIAATDVDENQFFADTITVTTAYTTAHEILPAAAITPDNTIAVVKVDVFGCEKLQVQVAKNSCDNVNALAAGF